MALCFHAGSSLDDLGPAVFFGRVPKKLLIPLILVTNLSSSTLTFLADNQNVLNSKTTFPLVSEYLVVLVGLQKPVGVICFLSLLFKHDFKVCPQSRNKIRVCVKLWNSGMWLARCGSLS